MSPALLEISNSQPPAAVAGPSRRAALVLLMGILVLAGWLRFHSLGDKSLWPDEGLTAFRTTRPFDNIVTGLRTGDADAPAYYWIAWLTMRIKPCDVGLLRLPSAVFGLATVLLCYVLATELMRNRWAGLVAAMALATNKFHLHYSQEARSYALYFLAAVAAMCCLARLTRPADTSGWRVRLALWAGFVLSTVTLVYTHYISAFFVVAIGAYYPLARWLAGRGFWKSLLHLIAAAAAVAVLYLPWLPVLMVQFRGVMGGCWINRPTWTDLWQGVGSMVWYVPLAPTDPASPPLVPAGVLLWVGVAWAVAALAAILVGWCVWTTRSRDRRAGVLALCVLGGGAAVVIFSLVSRPIYMSKVVIPVMVLAPLGLAGLAIANVTRERRLALWAVVAILLGGTALAVLGRDLDTSEEWKAAVDYAVQQAGPRGEPILGDDDFQLMTMDWHLRGSAYAPVRWDAPTRLLLVPGGSVDEPGGGDWPNNLAQAVARRARPGVCFWVIERTTHEPPDEVMAVLRKCGHEVGCKVFQCVDVHEWRIDRLTESLPDKSPTSQPGN